MAILDPLDRLLAELETAAPKIAKATGERLQGVVRQHFADGRAPVDSGALRDSVTVEVELGRTSAEVKIRSPLPYAGRHRDEMLPTPAEVSGALVASARGVLGG